MGNPYAGLDNAQMAGQKYPSLGEGKYKVRIDQVTYLKARKGFTATIVEFTVLASSNPSHPVGVKRSYFQKMEVDAAMGALKAFTAAVAGTDPKDSEGMAKFKDRELEEALGAAITPEQPFRGVELGLDLTVIKTKEGKDFGKHEWYPVEA